MLRKFPARERCAEFDGQRATDHMKALLGFFGNLQLLEGETGFQNDMIRYGPKGIYGISLGVILTVQPCNCTYTNAGGDLGSRPLTSGSDGRTGGARGGHVLSQEV